MTFLTLTILCSLISLGYLQETNNADYNLNLDVEKGRGNDWPQKSFDGQEKRNNIPQPCSRRSTSESEPIKKHILSPTHSSKIDTVAINDNTATLKPHALRNVDYNVKTFKNHEPQSYPHLYSDDNHIYKTKTPLLVSNPVIDSFEEIHHEVIPAINSKVQDNILKSIHHPYYPHSSEAPPVLRVPSEVYSAPTRDFESAPASQFHFVPNSEYGAAPGSQYLIPDHIISPEHNAIHSTADNDVDSVPSINFVPETTNDLHYEPQHLSFEPANVLHSEPIKQEPVSKVNNAATTAPNKCTHEEPDDLVGHSRRSMSTYNDDDNLKNNLNSDNDLVHNNNDQYIESRIGNENAMVSVLNAMPNTLKSNQTRNYPKFKLSPHEKIVLRAGRTQFNESRRELTEPTKGNGVTNMAHSSLMLMQTERICYACSTANNPSCWAPDRRTTVKYCRKGHTACITKTFGSGSTFTLIRDCGKSCDDSETGGLMPKYKSCSMCHTELCNGTYSINGHSIILALLLMPLIKYFN